MKINPVRKFSWLLVSLFVIAGSSLSANSYFSKYGLGLSRQFAGSAYLGAGNAGVAAFSPLVLQYYNPAAISYLTRTRFEGTFLYEKAEVTTSNSSGKISDSGFNTIHIGIPMTRGYALSFGLMPYSVLNYRFESQGTDSLYTSKLTGSGGIERGFLRLAGRIGNRVAWGAGMDVYFGRLEHTWNVAFVGTNFRNTDDVTSISAVGMGAHFGTLVHVNEKISVGAVWTSPTSLSIKKQVDYAFRTENDISEGTAKTPFVQEYGLNFRPSPSVMVLADISMANWGSVSTKDALGANTTNTFRYAAGIDVNPSKKLYDSFFKKVSYKLGFNAGTLPFLDVKGEKVQEQYVTAGISIPYNAFNSMLDMSFEYGTRGTLDKNIAEEKVFRFVFGIASGERWFVRPKGR